MKATEILIQEHALIMPVLSAMERTIGTIPGGKVRPGFFLDATEFMKDFVDGCHHSKEEGILFKSMEASGVPVQGRLLGVMLTEHEKGRAYVRAMRTAAEKWQAGDSAAVHELVANARGYMVLLRMHIYKENTLLFPLANRAIPSQKQLEVDQAFERTEREEVGEGIQEKYRRLAERLQKEADQMIQES
jgi:hemerythrin-like domain-containing protein